MMADDRRVGLVCPPYWQCDELSHRAEILRELATSTSSPWLLTAWARARLVVDQADDVGDVLFYGGTEERMSKRDVDAATGQIFARRLTERRRALGLSKARLARLVGVAPGRVSSWENWGTVPQSERRQALAAALQTTENYLLGRE
jgi:hypothetical protein